MKSIIVYVDREFDSIFMDRAECDAYVADLKKTGKTDVEIDADPHIGRPEGREAVVAEYRSILPLNDGAELVRDQVFVFGKSLRPSVRGGYAVNGWVVFSYSRVSQEEADELARTAVRMFLEGRIGSLLAVNVDAVLAEMKEKT